MTPIKHATLRIASFYLDCPHCDNGGVTAKDGSYLLLPGEAQAGDLRKCVECCADLIVPSLAALDLP